MEKIKQFLLGNREPAYSDKLNTQLLLTARTLVGGYLLYIVYSLKDSVMNPDGTSYRPLFIAAIILFVVSGVGLCYASIRDFLIGRYKGGKLDMGDKPEELDNIVEDSCDKEISGGDTPEEG